MALVIENEELLRLAAAEAANRGVSVSEFVESALRKELTPKSERIRRIVNEFSQGLPPGLHSSDHNDLYDENGLPQ